MMARRIVRRSESGVLQALGREAPQREKKAETSYLDRVKNLIPTEVAGIYLAGVAVIPEAELIGRIVWLIACFAATIFYTAKQTRRIEGDTARRLYPVDWAHVAISTVSFLVWAYALGDPFKALGIFVPWIGSLAILGWNLIWPAIYEGKEAELVD
jgi:hypothetical protein